MDYKSSSELKSLAREELSGKYGVPVGILFLAGLISIIVSVSLSIFFETDNVTSYIVYYIVSYIISLLLAVLELGVVKFFMSFCRKQEYQLGDMFWGFKNHPDKIIIFMIILTLIMFGCLVPGIIFIFFGAFTVQPIVFVGAVILLIAGVLFGYIIGLSYSMVPYLVVDKTEYSITELMRESKEMMRGHKGRLFYLQISFIGWYLLALLSCGIAMLWIGPYRITTFTFFYMDLKGEFRTTTIDERV